MQKQKDTERAKRIYERGLMKHLLFCIGTQVGVFSIVMIVFKLCGFKSVIFPIYIGVAFFVFLGVLVALMDWRNIRRQVFTQA